LADLLQYPIKTLNVLTQPDRPSGRGKTLTPTAVKDFALSQRINCFSPIALDDRANDEILRMQRPDLMIIVAYGLLIPEWLIEWPALGAINIHTSLLPRWRGASPIQSALKSGDKETGITIMRVSKKLDEGNIIYQSKLSTEGIKNTEELSLLMEEEAKVFFKDLFNEAKIDLSGVPQNHEEATYCQKIKKTDGLIDWNTSALSIFNLIRAYNPWPMAYSFINTDSRIRIIEAEVIEEHHHFLPGQVIEFNKKHLVVACKENALKLVKVQLDGGKVITHKDLFNSGKNISSFG